MRTDSIRGVLLDIEGTTSSIAFVADVLFPFAARELEGFLARTWDDPGTRAACERIASDAGQKSLQDWAGADDFDAAAPAVIAEVRRLMEGDVKATGLKELQGLIWRGGYESGELRSHVYPDVPPALEAWQGAGLDLRIYSSGSVAAQKLFFGHTEAGDLLPRFSGHYDTTIGSKKEAASYRAIQQSMNLPAAQILFVSDVVAELDAAREAGLRTALSIRPGNAPAAEGHGHPAIRSFAEIDVGAK